VAFKDKGGLPNLISWLPDPHTAATASIAKFDAIILPFDHSDHIASIRALNPDIGVLTYENAANKYYNYQEGPDGDNAAFVKCSMQWVFTQAGSTLASTCASGDASLSVTAVDADKFVVGDLIVCDEELMRVTGKSDGTPGTLNVTRAVAASGTWHSATGHTSGVRIAAAGIYGSNSTKILMNITSGCPTVDLGGGYGAEDYATYYARVSNQDLSYGGETWDGSMIDVANGELALGSNRTYDPNNSNSAAASATWNAMWTDGIADYTGQFRALTGDDVILTGNNAETNYSLLNGNYWEGFPSSDGSWDQVWTWYNMIMGYQPEGNYLEWMANCATGATNMTHMEVYETTGLPPTGWPTDPAPTYRKMRFGLGTTLLEDGYFAYSYSNAAVHAHGGGIQWFDEYDNAGSARGYLGRGIGSAYYALPAIPASANMIDGGHGDFDAQHDFDQWSTVVGGGASGSWSWDNTQGYGSATGCMKANITNAPGDINYVSSHYHASGGFTSGQPYTIQFAAKASAENKMRVYIAGAGAGSPYMKWSTKASVRLGTDWKEYELSGVSNSTDATGYVNFMCGSATGQVWIDDVRVLPGRRDVWRRDFDNGVVLVNPGDQPKTVSLGGVYRKIQGTQDPVANDGFLYSSVTIPAVDACILLNPGPSMMVVHPPG